MPGKPQADFIATLRHDAYYRPGATALGTDFITLRVVMRIVYLDKRWRVCIW
jgi:hypothetical protein